MRLVDCGLTLLKAEHRANGIAQNNLETEDDPTVRRDTQDLADI